MLSDNQVNPMWTLQICSQIQKLRSVCVCFCFSHTVSFTWETRAGIGPLEQWLKLHTHTSWVNDPRANIYSPLTLNFASILVNCSLVRSAIIQTGNANVNEFRFAYLYFPMVEMSLVMTLYNEECHFWWPHDKLLAIKRPKKQLKKMGGKDGNKKGN